MSAVELEFVDALPEPRRRKSTSDEGAKRRRTRPTLVTETGDRYVAPDSHREHGTHAKYAIERCRCLPCTEASREYNRWQRHNLDAVYVDAQPAREHVRAMMAAGYGYQLQAEATGVAEQTYQNLLYGGWRVRDGKRRKRPPARRIRPATADRILSFRPEQGTAIRIAARSAKRVPALPLARRWHRLLDAGWWTAAASKATGVNRQALDHLTHRRGVYTSAKVAEAIALLETLPVPEGKARRTRDGRKRRAAR